MLQERNHNIDLLKLFAMFGIVFIHSVTFGGLLELSGPYPFQGLVASLMYAFMYAMTNVFVIVSAWFLPSSRFQWKKVWRMAAIASAYSLLVYVALIAAGKAQFGAIETLRSALALFSNQYWFITAYMIMYVLSPYLNEFLDKLEEGRLALLCLILLTVFSVVPTLLFFLPGQSLADASNGQGFFWFLVIYCCVFFLRKFRLERMLKVKAWQYFAMIAVCVIFLAVSRPLLTAVSLRMGNGGAGSLRFYFNSSVPVFLISVSTFALVLKMPMVKRGGKLISSLSATTLGIYLIHAQPTMNGVLWSEVRSILAAHPSSALVMDLGIAAAVFVVCMVIDLSRSKLLR